MRSTWTDTDAATESEQIRLLRGASVSRRFHLLRSLTASALWLSRRAVARQNPGASPAEVGLRWVGLHYGAELEEEVRRYLREKRGP